MAAVLFFIDRKSGASLRKLVALVLLLPLSWQVSLHNAHATQGVTLGQARRHFQMGKYDKAIAEYEELVGSSQKSAALLGLAEVQLQVGQYEQAEKSLREALVSSPKAAAAMSLLGDVFQLTGRYDEARASYEKALSSNPNLLSARFRLGEMQWRWGQRKQAQETLNYFISYYRDHRRLSGEDLYWVAQSCVYLDRVRDANGLFNDAASKDTLFWQAFVPWGDLMLSKYNEADAKGIFEDALRINPNAAPAKLGLAKIFRSTDFQRALAEAEAALTINKNLVAAHDFLADLDISTGDSESGLEHTEAALKVNPHSLTTRTLRAIIYYLADEKGKFRAEEEKILAINPAYGEFYYQVAEMLAKRYLFQESVDFYKKAVALDPQHWSAFAGLGTSLSRLGQENAAKDDLERSFQNDPFNKHVGNLLTLFDEFPQYKTHQTKHLTIRIHEKDDAVLSGYATSLAEQCFSGLLKTYPADTLEQIIVEIFPSHDDFAVRCFGLPGAQAFLGICFGNVVAMDSPRARSKGDFVWGETLWHELVHVTHLRLTANRIPRWLAEGIAVYETSRARPYWSMNLDLPFVMAYKNNRTLPLKELDAGFNRPTSPGQVTLSYFQASLVVEFIVTKYGQEKLFATFPEFKAGAKTPQVIEKVFGLDIDSFDQEFQEFLKAKYRFEDVDYTYDPQQAVAETGELEGKLTDGLAEHPNNPLLNFRLGMYYKSAGDIEGAVTYLERAKELFPNFVENDNPYTALAELYVEKGQTQDAIRELKMFTARNGKDLRTLKWLAKLCSEAGDTRCVIEALEKAIYVTPFDSEIHSELARAYLLENEYDQAVAEYRINLLVGPQDKAGANCDLAEALLKAGRPREAKKAALAALEIAPNYERAQEILLASIK